MINSKNFDNIRSVALVFILLIHTVLNNFGIADFTNEITEKSLQVNSNQILMGALYSNLFKPGTVLFFIISGFLFEIQYAKFNSFSVFIKRKAKSLLRPYLILFLIPNFIFIWFIEPNFGVQESYDLLYLIFVKPIKSIFLTNYWFVPALFVTLLINFFIKPKYVLKSLILFIAIWILAYVNLYFKFVLTAHTVWFTGFFFIFTLGRLIYAYNDKIANFKLINKNNLIFAVVLFYIISNIESMIILNYGYNVDCVNTLRIGNILYSFSLFFLLNTLLNEVDFILPIDISFYFVYLIHPFVLKATIFLMLKNNLTVFGYPMQYFYNIIHFLIVITTCVAIQQIFFKLRFKPKYLSEYVFKK